eukprot:SM008381S23432  [mRNA]  locus=s8381:272:533:- [translate_table: standard]
MGRSSRLTSIVQNLKGAYHRGLGSLLHCRV